MNAKRIEQLQRINALCERREQNSLTRLRQQEHIVKSLEHKRDEIVACIDEFIDQINALNDQRLCFSTMTVEMLQTDVASRAIVERDLRKERFYLETADKDVSEAKDELEIRRSQWRKLYQRLDALKLAIKQHTAADIQQAHQHSEHEIDDLVSGRHGIKAHG